MPLRALAGVSAPELWSPAYLASAKLWLKGDELAGADASAIPGWPDSSGSGNDPVIGIAPLLQIAELNSLNVVEFTAASSHFLHVPWAMISAWTEGSVFFVAKLKTDPPASAPETGPIIGGFGNSGQTSLYPFTDSTVYDEFLTSARKTVGNPGDLATWHIGSMQSKASDWRYAFNGADFFTTVTNTVGIPLDTDVGPYIGTNGGQFLDGYIAEIVFCNSFLTTGERQNIEGYLAHKWGLTANLDVGHPYKTTPPIVVSTAYSLTADGGTFSFTGQASGLLVGSTMAGGQASFTYSGQTASLLRSLTMAGAVGTFTYTGQPSLLEQGYALAAGLGTFSYTGQAAATIAARAMPAVLGTFTYTGQTAVLGRIYTMPAGLGTFSYTGPAAGTIAAFKMAGGLGTFSYTGQANLLERGYSMPAGLGTFSYAGQAANFAITYSMPAGLGTFSYAGQAATIGISATMTAALGAFSYAGQSSRATLSYDSVPPSGGGGGGSVKVTAFFYRP